MDQLKDFNEEKASEMAHEISNILYKKEPNILEAFMSLISVVRLIKIESAEKLSKIHNYSIEDAKKLIDNLFNDLLVNYEVQEQVKDSGSKKEDVGQPSSE